MAFLSSVFGTALGSAAKVGSEAIREARQRDRLTIEDFKKNVQAKKAAFTKQQAEATKKAEEINKLAQYLSDQEGYENFNSIELNDLALKLTQMAGNKNPYEFFLDSKKDDKLTLTPKARTVQQLMPTGGMRDLGLVDGKPSVAALELEMQDVPLSRTSFLTKDTEPTPTTLQGKGQSVLSPVKRKKFFAEALVGKDLGSLQREALREMGMTEEQFNQALSSMPKFPQDNNTATFIASSDPSDDVMTDRIKAADENIRKTIFEKYPEMLTTRVPVETGELRDRGLVDGQPVAAEKVIKMMSPFQNYEKFMTEFLTGTDPKTKQRYINMPAAQERMQDVQRQVLMSFGANEKLKKLVNGYDDVYKERLKKLYDLSNTLTPSVKESLGYTQTMTKIAKLQNDRIPLMFDGANEKQVMQMTSEISSLVTDLTNKLSPAVDEEQKRKKYKDVNDVIKTLEKKERLAKRMSTTDFEAFVKLRSTFNKNLKLQNPDGAMDKLFVEATRLLGNLDIDPKDLLTDRKKEQASLSASLYSDWLKNNGDASEEKKKLAKDYISNWVRADNFNNLKDKELNGQTFGRRVEIVSDGMGGFKDVVRYVSLDTIIDNVALKPGFGVKEYSAAVENVGQYTQSLMDLGYLTQVAERDGLAFGVFNDGRRFFGNAKEIARDLSSLTGVGTNIFANLKNEDAYLERVKQIAINFISAAKNQLFKDPRLSDQDLSLVLNFIGILGRPGEIKLIGQSNALTAIYGLERVFLAQLARNMYIARGKDQTNAIMAGDFRLHPETGVEEVDLSKDSMAATLFDLVAKTRGINLEDFTGEDGNLDDDKIANYFSDPSNTFGYASGDPKNPQPLNGPAGLAYFAETIDEITNSVIYALDGANAITQYKSGKMFQDRHITSGTALELTNNTEQVQRTQAILQRLADEGVPGATELLKDVKNGKRKLYGGNWERKDASLMQKGLNMLGMGD
jgi:hypothetical protein|tara:strand:+ start:280 stop:3171 length:2892 start_codon:yes stop_codon:yes gene_type:complete